MPTSEEITILRLVNAARLQGTTQLSHSATLYRTAGQHSRNMLRQGRDFHQTAQQLQSLALRHGYTIIGENLATGFAATQSAQLVARWMASPLHRQNIENRVFEEAAVAVAARGSRRYCTLHLGGRGPELHVSWQGSRQTGQQWTHEGRILVRDNRDRPLALRVFVQVQRGTGITIQPSAMPLRTLITAQHRFNGQTRQYGVIRFSAIQRGMARFTLRIYALDARGNRSVNIDLQSN